MCSEKGSVQRDFQTGFKVSVFINLPGQPEFPTLTWSQFLRISPVELIFSHCLFLSLLFRRISPPTEVKKVFCFFGGTSTFFLQNISHDHSFEALFFRR